MKRGTTPIRHTGRTATAARDGAAALTGQSLRGSSLLLSGRGLALGIKLVSQLALVRYLSTADYGAWAQALAAVTLLGAFSALSLDRGVTRFASIFHERRDYERFFGALLLVTGAILVSTALMVAGLYGFPEYAHTLLGGRAETLALLFLLIFLVPLEALDQLCIAMFATLGSARAIFFRKYLLGPVLQLAAVLLLIGLHADVTFLAATWLAATVAGVAVNLLLLMRLFQREGLLDRYRIGSVSFPVRVMFAFALPLMTADWLEVLVQSSGPLMLGYVAGVEQVALFRVVVPLALVGQIVVRSFDMLYVPTASRLFAAGDRSGIEFLYWRTAFWVAVVAFPIFAVTFTAATPVTVLLYGPRYASSGEVLAILACGIYAKAALSFSSATLKVLGHVRWLAGINLLSAGANIVMNLMLVPRYGVLGAALAMSGTMTLDAVLKHETLRRLSGISVFAGPQRRSYPVLLGIVGGLVLVRGVADDEPVLLIATAVVAAIAALVLTRSALGLDEVFPELRRFPLLRMVIR